MGKVNLADLGDEILKTSDENPVEDVIDIQQTELYFKHIKDLAPYLAIAENIHEVNQFTAPALLGKLAIGLRKAGDYLAVAKYRYKTARSKRKEIEAIVAIDEFREYVRSQSEIKVTEAMRTHFVNRHPDVIKAAEREAFFEAIQEQLVTMKTELFMSITTARNIAYGFRDNLPAIATPSED